MSRSAAGRIRPSISHHNPLIQRLQTRHVSSSPASPSLSNCDPDPHQSSASGSVLKWVSGVALGSSLGLLYLSSSSSSPSGFDLDWLKKTVSPLVEWSTPDPDAAGKDRGLLASSFQKLSLPDSSSMFLFGDAYRRKIFFNYERRIRLRSPPEKVFEYFASYRAANGESLMKPADLMRAVVPVFPPSESNLVRDGYLVGERRPGELRCDPSEFFMLFDVNNDGLISFKEYIFFVTLLSIPESSFSIAFKMFDINNNGEIDKEEFKKVMALMRAHNRQGALHRDGRRPGLKIHGSVENGGIVEYFFGEDGTTHLHLDKFAKFLKDLQDEILRLEFDHYDYKLQGTISATDFALSMVASANISHLNKLLDRVDGIKNEPHLKDIRITFEEFKYFAKLREQLQPFALAVFSYGKVNGLLTRTDLQRAASHVCGLELTDNVVDIIYHVFDTNQDGSLTSDEFIRVLYQREKDIAQPVGGRLTEFLFSRFK